MAVREFLDDSGRRWRAWCVAASDIHPAIRTADYVAPMYQWGWLVFETVSGDEKRRLSLFPPGWADASDVALRALLARAESGAGLRTDADRPVVAGTGATSAMEPQVEAQLEAHEDVAAGPPVVRTFRYPGGRYWTASALVRPDDARPVLRFTAGARIIELGSWPKEWADAPDDVLVELLRWAAPRREVGTPPPGVRPRRWDDPPDRAT